MSSYLNDSKTNANEEYFIENINGEYVKYIKQYTCDYNNCGKRFAYKEELLSHLETHT